MKTVGKKFKSTLFDVTQSPFRRCYLRVGTHYRQLSYVFVLGRWRDAKGIVHARALSSIDYTRCPNLRCHRTACGFPHVGVAYEARPELLSVNDFLAEHGRITCSSCEKQMDNVACAGRYSRGLPMTVYSNREVTAVTD